MHDVIRIARENLSDVVELCRALVRINTANPYSGDANPGGEKKGQEYLAEVLRDMGQEPEFVPCPPDIYEKSGVLGPRDRVFADRPNIVSRFRFGDGGPSIIVNGHMDTVGIDNMGAAALSAELVDGRIIGRGTTDCKGGIAVAIGALQTLQQLDLPLHGEVIFQSVVDEECNGSGAGTLTCLHAGYTGDEAVFVDGEDSTVTLGCGGCLTAGLTVEGQEGHAAMGTGVSSIEKAIAVKAGIDAFKLLREATRPRARVNLGVFHAGVHPAVVPGKAQLSLNIVYELDEAQEAQEKHNLYGGRCVRETFEGMVRAAESRDAWLANHPSEIEWVKDLIPFRIPPDSALAQGLISGYEKVLGTAPTVNVMDAWTDSAYPAALYDIPTALIGPSAAGAAHSSHEYVEVDALLRATKLLAVFLADRFTRH